jgi:hypothetical protein
MDVGKGREQEAEASPKAPTFGFRAFRGLRVLALSFETPNVAQLARSKGL